MASIWDDGIDIDKSRRVWLLLNTLEGNDDRAVEITDSENVVRLDSAAERRELPERFFSEVDTDTQTDP